MDNTNPNPEDKYKDLNEFIAPNEIEQKTDDKSANITAATQLTEPTLPKKPKRKKMLIILAVVLVVGGAAIAWFMTKGAQKAQAPAANDQNMTAVETDEADMKPAFVAYAFGDAAMREVNLFTRPVNGGERSGNATFPKNNYLTHYGVHKNKAFYVTEPGFGAKADDKLTIRYSKDGGKSYSTVFEGNPIAQNNLGDQVTSARFSTDGSRIVFGLLPVGGSGNQVKELDPETKKVNDLFSEEEVGVFVHAYDTTQKKVVYSTGCYNCDGNMNNRAYERTIGSDKKLLYEYEGIGEQTVVNKDFSKILVVVSTPGDGLGGGAPYRLDEFDITSKTFRNIVPKGNEYPRDAGYSEEGSVYFAVGNKVTQIGSNGNQSVLFEAAKPIYEVLFVGLDQVVASVGDVSDFELVNFNVKENKTTSILSGDNVTYLFGVTWQ